MIFTDIQKMFLFPLYSKIKRKEKRRKVPAGGANGSIVPFFASLVFIFLFSLSVMFSKQTAFAFHMEDDGILPPFLFAAIFHS